jgi:flagellar basal-body rod protein FlgG
MSETMSLLAASMQADAEALRLVAQNLAGAEIPAYRRQVAVNTIEPGFDRLLTEASLQDLPAAATGLPAARAAIDMTPGTFKATGRALDVAIEGNSFFALQSAAGIALTRRGDFHVNAEGLLTAASGEPVLGEQGVIQIGTQQPTIEPDGTVRIGSDVIDRLQMLSVADRTKLIDLGNGSYAPPADATPTLEDRAVLHQGSLETSNVAPVNEMIQLMETMRHFETAQRFVRGYDQMLEKAISELGKVG